MIQSVRRMALAPLGFQPDHLLSLAVHFPPEDYAKPEQAVRFFDNLTSKIRGLRRVRGVALGHESWNAVVAVEGRPAPPANVTFGDCGRQSVSSGFYRLMGIQLYRGRDFDTGDRAGSEAVAIVNLAFANRYFPGGNPIGRMSGSGCSWNNNPG